MTTTKRYHVTLTDPVPPERLQAIWEGQHGMEGSVVYASTGDENRAGFDVTTDQRGHLYIEESLEEDANVITYRMEKGIDP